MTTQHPAPHVCGIIPPHVLEHIARNGSSTQQRRASRSLSVDGSLRRQRRSSTPTRGKRGGNAAAPAAKNRQIFDAKQQTDLPGDPVRAEGAGATDDVAVNEAYDYMGATWDFYDQVFQRNSWDDGGGDLIGTVHFDRDYDNAFWNGEQMVYGDGDGEIFNRFTISVDVIGHELTHGVTQAESNLTYSGQSGALNESISDVFGSMVKQHLASETADQADWLIGEGLFTAAVKGVALRSMAEPGTAYDDPVVGKDPQPAHMDDYVETTQDNGGVHINSGIPNRAFYLFAVALGGHAWDKAGRVWYATCTDKALAADADFQAFADLTSTHAASLFGESEQAALAEAWAGVGITVASSAAKDLTSAAK
jgi:Zn-dependent metalloprotease